MNAVAATQFAPDPRRRALIGKVKVAQKQLGMTEDDYRATILRVTGQMSATTCSEVQLVRLVEHFKSIGFKPMPGKAKGARGKAADHPSARKARALWISLHQLGAIDNPAEAALEAFARRQLHVETLQWANQAQCYKLIEALKSIAERHGWRQRVDYVSLAQQPFALRRGLADAILAKLKAAGIASAAWSLGEAAFRLCGIGRVDQVLFEMIELENIARALGEKLRTPVRPVTPLELRR